MATTIQNLHSLTAGNKPGDLAPGELAYNLADGYVYLGNGGNNYIDTLGGVIGPSINPGGGWQQSIFNAAPVPGAVTLAGTYNAQDNLITSVTSAGTAAGFATGALPAAAAGNTDFYLLVQIGGTLTPPAPTGDANPGDWLVSTGTAWALVDYSNTTIPASNVTLIPGGDITATDVQTALTVQLPLIYTTIADGVVSELNCNGNAQVYGSTTLGDASADTLTVNATSAFAAPVAMASTLQVTGALSSTTSIYSAGTLRVDGAVDFRGNVSLGNASTDTVTVAGPITAGNNLTVTGVTQLNGASQVNGDLTTTGAVALSGTAGVTLGTNFTTTGAVGITLGGSSTLTVNSASAQFTGGCSLSIRGPLALTGGSNNYDVTYTRPLTTAGVGQAIVAPLQQFLVIPGTIIAFGGNAVPAGYVPCDGRSLSTLNNYADLFAAIGYSWGGTGSSFNVPDLRGLYLRGTGTNAKIKTASGVDIIGGVTGSYKTDSFRSHSHDLKLNTTGYKSTQFNNQIECLAPATNQQNSDSKQNSGTITVETGGGGGTPIQQSGSTETAPVTGVVFYCIKF
jgi:hypothetical protein